MPEKFTFTTEPAPEVRRYFEAKGLKPSFNWRDVWAEEHAFAFAVAKATELDVLTTIRNDFQEALLAGQTPEHFAKNLEPRLRELGWWGKKSVIDPKTGEAVVAQLGSPRRLKTIFWANSRTAHAAGAWERAQRTKRALPYLVYLLGPSIEHRPHHVERAGTVLPVDDPFWDSWYPPNGWGCKCWVRQITRHEAEDMGGVSETPDIPTRTYRNRRTGQSAEIPVGIDPGWHTNPGKARARNVARFLGEKLDAAPGPELARIAVADMVGSQAFGMLARGEFKGKVFLPVAMMSPELSEIIGAKTRTVFLSSDDVRKMISKRPEIGAPAYAKAQRLIGEAEIIQEDDTHFALNAILDGVWWRLILKVTKRRDEVFLNTLHRLNDRQIKNRRRRGPVLRDAPGGSKHPRER